VLGVLQEHEDRDWRALIIGLARPLKVSSLDDRHGAVAAAAWS
jgi:hypothetical protein